MKTFLAASVVVLVGAASPAFGQGNYWPVFGNDAWQPRAATAEESWARGAADVIRSAGQANLMNSEAANNWEEARSKNFDNRLKWTQTYFEMKRYNKEYRDALKGPRPTSEQLFRMAKEAAPQRLGTSDLDPVTGAIDWPLELTADVYGPYREVVDSLFSERAEGQGQVGVEQYGKIQSALDQIQHLLDTRVRQREVAPQDWTTANRFLKQLRHESRFAG